MVARPLGVQDIGLPNPAFAVENSGDDNPIHPTHSICTHNMHGVEPITTEHSPTARPTELHNVQPAQFWRTSGSALNVDCHSERFPVQKNRAINPYYQLLSYNNNDKRADFGGQILDSSITFQLP